MAEAQIIKGIEQGDHKPFQILTEIYRRIIVGSQNPDRTLQTSDAIGLFQYI